MGNNYNDLLQPSDVMELIEMRKPTRKNPETGNAFKDPSGWIAVVIEPTTAKHLGSHLLLVQRPIDNSTVIQVADDFSSNPLVHIRYLRITQGLTTAKARLNAVMTRVGKRCLKSKRSGNVLGDDISDEQIVELLGEHGMETLPGFEDTGSDGYGSDDVRDLEDGTPGGKRLLSSSLSSETIIPLQKVVQDGRAEDRLPNHTRSERFLSSSLIPITKVHKLDNISDYTLQQCILRAVYELT